jgi:tetratricopeptide (TPR) repeat protein
MGLWLLRRDGNTCCGNWNCCGAGDHCCPEGETCCGSGCCPEGYMCCDGECCPDSTICGLGLSKKTDNPETLLKYGWLALSQGNWQESISYFEKGLAKFDGKPVDVLYALARMYEEMGNKQKAKETYWQLLTLLGDTSPEIQKVESRIISLENK